MYAFTQELVPATGVTKSVVARLLPHSSQPQLVTVKSNLIVIYEIVNGDAMSHVFTQDFLRTIEDVQSVANPQNPAQDLLFVAFADAKLSLLQWNANQHHFETVSLHFYESEVV